MRRVPILVLALFAASLSAQVLPDAPSHSRTIPRDEQVSWWAFTAVDVAATVADAAVSTHAHVQPGIGHCHEGNPLFGGPYPSARRVWAQQIAGVAGLTALTWWLKKRRHPWWGVQVVPGADAAGVKAGGGDGMSGFVQRHTCRNGHDLNAHGVVINGGLRCRLCFANKAMRQNRLAVASERSRRNRFGRTK